MTALDHPLPLPAAAGPTKRSHHLFRWAWFGTLVALIVLTAVTSIAVDLPGQANWKTIRGSDPGANNYPHMMARDAQANTWMTTDVGLAKLDSNGQWTDFRYPGQWEGIGVAPVIDQHGQVWVMSSRYGVSRLSLEGHWTDYQLLDSGLNPYNVNVLAIDGQDRVWVGANLGLIILSPDNHWNTYTTKNSELPYDSVDALAVDRQGRMWVGNRHGGVNVVDPAGRWANYPADRSGAKLEWVGAIAVDSLDRVWVAASNGLSRQDADGQFTGLGPIPGAGSTTPVALAVDQQGNAWVSVRDSLDVLEPDGHWVTYTGRNSGLPGVAVSIVFDSQGQPMIGTGSALLTLDQAASTPPELVDRLLRVRSVSLELTVAMVFATGLYGLHRRFDLGVVPLLLLALWLAIAAVLSLGLPALLPVAIGSPSVWNILAGLSWLLYLGLTIAYLRTRHVPDPRAATILFVVLVALAIAGAIGCWRLLIGLALGLGQI